MNKNQKEDLKKFKGKNTKIAGFGMRMGNILNVVYSYTGYMGPFDCILNSRIEGIISVCIHAYGNERSYSIGIASFKVDEFKKAEKFIQDSVIGFMDKATIDLEE